METKELHQFFRNLTKLQIQHNCNAVSITGDINFEYTQGK